MDGFGRTGDEQVDPFVAKQHGALQVQLARSATNGGLSIFKVVQCDKLVAGDINDGGLFSTGTIGEMDADIGWITEFRQD